MLAMLLGAVLPVVSASTVSEVESTNRWRILFGMPLPINLLQLALFHFIFKEDSPTFLLSNGKREDVKILVKKLYKD
jgi:hypothetical protein